MYALTLADPARTIIVNRFCVSRLVEGADASPVHCAGRLMRVLVVAPSASPAIKY